MMPLPRAISFTSASGNTSSLRFSPTVATLSAPGGTGTHRRASSGSVTFSTCLPLRVEATTSSCGTTNP